MRLKSFRVQNYKKVRDTGTIAVGDLTVFVGKNESGKSAILRGLSKLNPSDGEKYDGLKEFPRRRFTDEFEKQDWPVATATFVLAEDDVAELAEICPELGSAKSVTCTRYYSDRLTVVFDPKPAVDDLRRRDFGQGIAKAVKVLESATAPDGKGEVWGALKKSLLSMLPAVEAALGDRAADAKVSVSEAHQAVAVLANAMTEEWHKGIFGKQLAALQQMEDTATTAENLKKARNWVTENIPQFIYFDKYDILDSAIHIPTFRQKIGQQPMEPRVRTTHCLFKHVKLDVAKLGDLGAHTRGNGENDSIRRQVDERAIRAASAEIAMTGKFGDWWDQRRHKFHYHPDGDYFRIWVSDDLDPSPIELDQRSTGMQYFFSFYLVFLVESEGEHENSILLLDEPGGTLHGTAQQKVVEFLRKISGENQTIYTTHHPFMIDPNHLEDARAVFEDPKTGSTMVSGDVWPRDKDSLFPLQAALGYQIAQSLFYSPKQLIVEGITDYWILKALDTVLKARGGDGLRPDIVLVPAGGSSHVAPLASMLLGHGVEAVTLLDGDDAGQAQGKKLKANLFADSPGKIIFASDHLDSGQKEIESYLPEDWLLKAAEMAYPSLTFKFNSDEAKLPTIVDSIKAAAKRQGVDKIEKWRWLGPIRDRLLDKPKELPEANLKRVSALMSAINSAFT